MVNAALVQLILHIAKGQAKPDIQHHLQADHLGRCFEVVKQGVASVKAAKPSRPAQAGSIRPAPGGVLKHRNGLLIQKHYEAGKGG